MQLRLHLMLHPMLRHLRCNHMTMGFFHILVDMFHHSIQLLQDLQYQPHQSQYKFHQSPERHYRELEFDKYWLKGKRKKIKDYLPGQPIKVLPVNVFAHITWS